MMICQISDTHIKAEGKRAYGVVDTVRAFARCVQSVVSMKQRPDVLLLTGDIADRGDADEYALVREILSPLTMPTYVIPGNHDRREQMRASFADHDYLQYCSDFIQYAIEEYPVRIVALDTVIPKQSGGTLCEKRLRWLDETLGQAPDRPTIIMMHHPPFVTGLAYMDGIGLSNSAALGNIIERHPQVERIVCGHLHRSIVTRWHGTVASICPSPALQAELNLDPVAEPKFMLEPPGFQLHIWTEEMGLVSHTASIGEYQGPYPYFDGRRRIE
jgi:3',5'-cyclic AMP phosphodiesterase CpdA